ncbi:MAG: helix-turn-helix transcriptional regulator [Gemmatimonadaceae bacterium]|nr:helix-turn-helix transcriptional regulator [Gemmatimonadaceae bacterium]
MRPLKATSLGKLLQQVRQRAVARRLALGWTRRELAARTGIAPDTLKRFEQTGQISFERLLKIALAVDAVQEFGALFPQPVATSISELEMLMLARHRRRARARGATRHAPARDDSDVAAATESAESEGQPPAPQTENGDAAP